MSCVQYCASITYRPTFPSSEHESCLFPMLIFGSSLLQFFSRYAAIAQTVERTHGKGEVTGSIPVCG